MVELLADGRFQSGERLGERLGVTRAAIWKQLRGLERLGLSVQAVRGKGYRLARPLELLDADTIRAGLSPEVRQSLAAIEYFHELDSTNSHLRARGELPSGTVCLAECQTGGRGRRGRHWVSPYGANLYLSLAWRFEPGLAVLGGLSLAVGIALMRALRRLGVEDAGLKWPNDIYLRGSKLAGILVEASGESAGPCFVVIGIGINVAMPASQGARIDQQWTDLSSNGIHVSRNRLATALLDELVPILETYTHHGLQPFLAEWRRHDLSHGVPVQLQLRGANMTGKGMGIDQDGAFLLETPEGVQRFTSGQVSLRIAP